jgi:hypothetical protein
MRPRTYSARCRWWRAKLTHATIPQRRMIESKAERHVGGPYPDGAGSLRMDYGCWPAYGELAYD